MVIVPALPGILTMLYTWCMTAMNFASAGVAEDGVVRQADVRNIEVDVLGAVIFLAPEGDGKPDLA